MINNTLYYIGTYTETIVHGTGDRVQGQGEGIYALELDAAGQIAGHTLLAECANPSYLCVSRDKRFLYAVNELKEYEGRAQGAVSAYRIEAGGRSLTYLGSRPTGGADPCHVAISHSGRHVTVSNFTGGSICGYPVEEDGSLSEGQLIQHRGSGPDPLRQAGPHAHAATYSPRDRFVYVPDLGLDAIKIYGLDDSLGLRELGECGTSPGAGPRYCEKHPNCDRMIGINELDCSVTSYDIGESGMLTPISTVPMLGEDAPPSIAAALQISPDGRHVYGSIRGADLLACLRVGAGGELELSSRVPSGGRTPRDFALSPDGRFLLAAHQDSGDICVFAADRLTGALSPVCRYKMPTPVCVCPY